MASLLASLNERHGRLAAELARGSLQAADVDTLLSDIAAAGAIVPPGPERDGLRNLLYFWASDRTIRGQRPGEAPLPVLALFAGTPAMEVPPAATGRGQEAADTNASTSPGPPSSIEAQAIVRIASLARQWRLSADASKAGYLLHGKALVEASLFIDRDPDIADFVAASEVQERESQRRRRLLFRLLCVLAVFTFLGIVTWAVSAVLFAEGRLVLVADGWFRQVNAARSAIRDDNRLMAQQAVEGLNRGEVEPLKELLTRVGGASVDELKLLSLTATTPVERAAAATFVTPLRANEPPKVAQVGATCSGFLWFGDKSDSYLRDGRDPGLLNEGDTATLGRRADIRLREDLPSDGYILKAPIGLVPAGAKVKIVGAPRSYRTGAADQIWAKVSVPAAFCTTVFLLHYSKDASQDRSGSVLDTVRDLGAQAPLHGERYQGAIERTQVRYFYEADAAVAHQVGVALSPFNKGKPLEAVHVPDTEDPQPKRPARGTVEVWLHFKP